MAVLGIVAEYNPFHNGHLTHLTAARRAVPGAPVLVALSGPFTQRGEPALLSPWDRAACALSAGADAVFALPVLWTLRDAEHYALGAVSLLASLGATHLAFGAESPDLPLLRDAAALLESPPAAFTEALRAHLSGGLGFPAALSRAAGRVLPEAEALLNQPNNILAVSYLRALRRLDLPLTPVLIPRAGSYHAFSPDPASPSASALRESLRRGSWQSALPCLPPESRRLVRARFLSRSVPDLSRLDTLLLEKLRALSPAVASALPDAPEGLGDALRKAAARASSRDGLLSFLTSRRYPAARLSRLCACALLDVSAARLSGEPLPARAFLLGLKKSPALSGLWKDFPVSSSATDALADPAERNAYRLWGLLAGLPADFPFTQKMIS